jgi:hypothetical protein
VPLRLLEGTTVLWSGTISPVRPGEEMIIRAVLEEERPVPSAGPLKPEFRCAMWDLFAAATPDTLVSSREAAVGRAMTSTGRQWSEPLGTQAPGH